MQFLSTHNVKSVFYLSACVLCTVSCFALYRTFSSLRLSWLKLSCRKQSTFFCAVSILSCSQFTVNLHWFRFHSLVIVHVAQFVPSLFLHFHFADPRVLSRFWICQSFKFTFPWHFTWPNAPVYQCEIQLLKQCIIEIWHDSFSISVHTF